MQQIYLVNETQQIYQVNEPLVFQQQAQQPIITQHVPEISASNATESYTDATINRQLSQQNSVENIQEQTLVFVVVDSSRSGCYAEKNNIVFQLSFRTTQTFQNENQPLDMFGPVGTVPQNPQANPEPMVSPQESVPVLLTSQHLYNPMENVRIIFWLRVVIENSNSTRLSF